ncbi:MAG: hypothetical protein MJZ79_07680 [Paludibacteraceae bacterium]|nr:hypothetical protein [Paludibacteraceae bacterium]
MFEPGVVTYGFAKNITNPKNKYAISLFRDANVHVLIHFTTSQPRAGVPEEQIHHGINKNDVGEVMSFVFESGVAIGTTPNGGRFSFPQRTIMQFDYGFLRDTDWNLQQQFSNLEVKCHLDENIYLDLIYAMYRSKRTPNEYKSYLKKVLDDAYNG